MKNKIIMLICATLLCGSIGAQKISTEKVPASVASAFKAKFPTASKPTWKMEAGKSYEAKFKLNNLDKTALFSSTGNWVKTDTQIKVADLPTDVRQTITKQFAGYNIGEASKMENADHGNGYEVEINKGKEMLDVVLSTKGVVMSQEPRKAETEKVD